MKKDRPPKWMKDFMDRMEKLPAVPYEDAVTAECFLVAAAKSHEYKLTDSDRDMLKSLGIAAD